MIIKYVHNESVTCIHYENEKIFLNDCRKPEFRKTLFNAKDVIVLENDGSHYGYNTLLEVYRKYRNN